MHQHRRTHVLVTGTLLALLAIPSGAQDASSGTTQAQAADQLAERVKRGFEIAPVPLDLTGKSRILVGLGSYLVNAGGGCNDCHTQPPYAPGGDPFMGQPKMINAENYLAGGQIFGPFVSRNLTPRGGLPAGKTLEQFIDIMRNGTDYDDPGELLQVMPWPVYQEMTDLDLRAIYEFLRAIPPAQPGEPPAVKAK